MNTNTYDEIFIEDSSFFNYMFNQYTINSTQDEMIKEFSGIFIVNSKVPGDYSFKLMGTYSKLTKEEPTRKKQIYSLGIKTIRKLNTEKVEKIKGDFEKLIIVYMQLKQFYKIDELEKEKKKLN